MTKFNNLKGEGVKSNLKYTESKLVKKKKPMVKGRNTKKPLSYRYHAEKGITVKVITLRKEPTHRKASRKEPTSKKATRKEASRNEATRKFSLIDFGIIKVKYNDLT